MAVFAFWPERTLVRIVLGVAGNAVAWRVRDAVVHAVTTRTARADMFANKREVGVGVVIERCVLPATRVMTIAARGAA